MFSEGSKELRRRISEPLLVDDLSEVAIGQHLKPMLQQNPKFDQSPLDNVVQILSRRVKASRLRVKGTFDLDHCIKQEVERVCERHEKRLDAEWLQWAKVHKPVKGADLQGQKPTVSGLSIEDALGPSPIQIRTKSEPWKRLQKMIGLANVKEEIEHLINLAELRFQSDRDNGKPVSITLNRCFLGPPGVGKTTVAKLYGQILSELGLLSKGHVVLKTPADLIGQYIGHTEHSTKKALREAQGGILVIDDAHMLYDSSGHKTRRSDVFRVAAINTLVAEISGDVEEDRCVILCGYKDEMEEMFLNSNPGLQRRFPQESAIIFTDYSVNELWQILELKMEKHGVRASQAGQETAREVLSQMRTKPRFGNGGDVENLLSRAKLRLITRLKSTGIPHFDLASHPLEPVDFDPDFNRSTCAEKNRTSLFNEMVGFEDIVKQFAHWQKMADGMRRCGFDPGPHIPWAFVFKGPPGTGKTFVYLCLLLLTFSF